ncbi:hypothetical protein B0A48_17303 [Cryoendolithus antarcticus]|uniref:Uncharacterized protein n=1 Tax=Cryoendolithus antarcticus TaxID=1507870 RepID=A0A1V8SC53_9PEZI|nr:hypothetical protein B0A48_17303 [Cryoendolithus antarcticus]
MRGRLDRRSDSASSPLDATRDSAQSYDSYTPGFRSDQGYRGNYDPEIGSQLRREADFAQLKRLSAVIPEVTRLGYQTAAYGPAASEDTHLRLVTPAPDLLDPRSDRDPRFDPRHPRDRK